MSIPQDVTGTKFSQFKRIESSENLEVVGVEDGNNVACPTAHQQLLRHDPDVGEFVRSRRAPDLTNQLEVNRYLGRED